MTDTPRKPIIFLAFANPHSGSSGYLRNLAEEARQLRATLDGADVRPLCEVVVRENATVSDILDVFQDARYRNHVAIFHYGGHADGYRLLLQTVANEPVPADAGAIASFLGQQTGLELVFLNGCSTQPQAQGLLDAGVSVVIATTQTIDDRVATEFAKRFYKGLAGGATVRTAFEEAGAAVQIDRGPGTRHLYAARASEAGIAGCLPWGIYPPKGTEGAGEWRLSRTGRVPHHRRHSEPETVRIPAGLFWMGSELREGVPEYETPQHQVHLPTYWIGKYPVTNAQYAEFAAHDPKLRPDPVAGWSYIRPPQDKLNHPVVGVSWRHASAYCKWLGKVTGRKYRLPTEAEWEKAARGEKDSRLYPWGDELATDHCNYNGSQTTAVDRYDRGQSPYGCYDMVGNVREWTSTLWGSDWREPQFTYPYERDGREAGEYQGRPSMHQPSPAALRICRGGAYDDRIDHLRCSWRGCCPANTSDRNLGFRVVREA
jgi:formylglycine-generating enzyme required for sulfatase activity